MMLNMTQSRYSRFIYALLIFAAAASASGADVIHVPGDRATIGQAVAAVPNGGTILLAPGTYSGGFNFNNLGKAFTIRAESAGTAFLDGGGVQPVFQMYNSVVGAGGPFSFENLVFRNGLSTTDGVSGGVTLSRADATFIGCSFENNTCNSPTTGGGGVAVVSSSAAHFIDCIWNGNIAKNEAAGLRVNADSIAFVHDSQFLDNSASPPNHRTTAAGGAIHVGNAALNVSNTRFDGNRAGYVGGGLFVIGNWQEPIGTPRATARVANCTFTDNRAEADPSVTTPTPPEGGAIHAEDQSSVKVFGSRFEFNFAERGGAINSYRAGIEVHDSVLRGNWVEGSSPSTGFGGSFAITSADTTIDGSTNRPNASLLVANSLVQGRYGSVGAVAQAGGCIAVIGDINREYGFGGVAKLGPTAANRTSLVLSNVVFSHCDVNDPLAADKGIGGAVSADLGSIAANGILAVDSDAEGTNSTGGALRVVIESIGDFTDSTFANNSAGRFGGAIFAQGSVFDCKRCTFLGNEVSPGTAENVWSSYGAALFAGPLEGYAGIDMPMEGTVADGLFADNVGLPVFDDDRAAGPINDLRYNGNQFHSSTFGTSVYLDSLVGPKSVSELNSLIVTRNGGVPSTDKSQIDNSSLGSVPSTASLFAVPSKILPVRSAGDGPGGAEAFLAWAWSGASATLNGSPLASTTGVSAAGGGTSTLNADGVVAQASISTPQPSTIVLSAVPNAISSGQSATLQWQVTNGTYVDVEIDSGVRLASGDKGSSGSVVVSPTVTTTFRILTLTEEGGAVAEATIWVDEQPPSIFSDGFESGGTLAWSATIGAGS